MNPKDEDYIKTLFIHDSVTDAPVPVTVVNGVVNVGGAPIVGGSGGGATPVRITRWMRVYFYADLRWISFADDNYGHNTENASESGGVGVDPLVEWENRGEPFKKGDVIKSIDIRSRASATDITDVEVYFMFVHPDPITQWATGLDNDSELANLDLYRGLWKTPVAPDTQIPFTNPINDINQRKYVLDYTVPEDGDLRIFFKPVGTNTATRYFYPAIIIDYDMA